MVSISPNVMLIRRALNGPRAVYSITKHPRLYLAADGSGGGSWRIKYRPSTGGSQRWHTLTNDARNADFDDVVRRASELVSNLQLNGVDPKAHRKKHVLTFGVAFRLWLERHAKVRKKSWAADLALYERHVKRRLADDAMRSIDRARVIEVLDDIADRATPIQANRCQSLISAVFSWSLDESKIDHHPALRIRRRGEERSRELIMTSGQLKLFWAMLDELPENSATIIKLLLLTGARLSEVTAARTDEFELSGEGKHWRLPGPRAKNGIPHVVPLTPAAATLAAGAMRAGAGSPFLFPARRIEPQPFDGNHASRQCKTIFRQIGVGAMRLHDLRHQVATGMAQSGVPLEIRQIVLNQISGRKQMIGSRYDQHDYFEEKRRALALWEARLSAIVSGGDVPTERY